MTFGICLGIITDTFPRIFKYFPDIVFFMFFEKKKIKIAIKIDFCYRHGKMVILQILEKVKRPLFGLSSLGCTLECITRHDETLRDRVAAILLGREKESRVAPGLGARKRWFK